MRIGYSVSKVVTFCGLALAQAFGGQPDGSRFAALAPQMLELFRGTAWVALAFCVFRGLPVIVANLRRYWGTPAEARG